MGKSRKKGRSRVYDPVETMRPIYLPPDLEPIARDLFDKACCGSRSVWGELKDLGGFDNAGDELRKGFMSLANKGMRDAQKYIIDRVNSSSELSAAEDLLFRGVADSIAWQFLGNQLCHARRLFKEQEPPNLKESNFRSVVNAVEDMVDRYPDSMPLISDLTSFVQVGDIIASIPEQGVVIAEVKEGEENKRIADFMKFYMESRCDKALQFFYEKNGPKSFKQLSRMVRQMGRMSHFVEVVSKGVSEDPDTGLRVQIPEEVIQIDSWDEDLNRVLENPEDKGWGIGVIDESLFFGCYFHGPMRAAGHAVFNSWFDSLGGTENCPRARLFDSMALPLALPVFNRQIPHEKMFDLLFGRLQVCMGVNVECLLKQCEKEGLQVRFGSNKEASKLDQLGLKPYRHKGKAIFIGDGEVEMAIADGVFMRMLFHGQKPISLIKAMLKNTPRGE